MYKVPAFMESRAVQILRLVETHNFATFIHADGVDISVTHAPVLLRAPSNAESATQVDGTILEMHLARSNVMCKRLETLPRLTVVVTGPSSYVTPCWYETPGVVPTWNYAAVHLHCEASPVTSVERVHEIFDRTAAKHEPTVGGGWNREGSRQEMVDRLINGVVGYELTVLSHEAIFKMSQNKSLPDRVGVISGLRGLATDGANEVADMMQTYLNESLAND